MGHEDAIDAPRPDGRVANQLRAMAAEPGALTRADGSTRFSHDETQVLVGVHGPCEAKRSRERLDGAVLEVMVRPRAGLQTALERELEQLICQTLQPVVHAALHPRSAVSVVVQVLAADGALLTAALHGVCVALMHAGVPLRGMIAGCTAAILPSGAVLLDPCASEEAEAQAVLSLAYMLRQRADGRSGAEGIERELLLCHTRGQFTPAQYNACELAAREAAICVEGFFRQALARSAAPLPQATAAPDEVRHTSLAQKRPRSPSSGDPPVESL